MKLKQSAALIMSIAMSFGMTSVPALATSSSNGSESNIVVEHVVDSSSRFMQNGENTQYPAEGGVWKYGYWETKARSYYTVNLIHGSTVKVGEKQSRSVDTARGRKSIAEVWTLNLPTTNAHYYYRVCE